MAANRFGIDVGEALRTTESIKGARTRNKMAELQLSEAQREVDQRPFRENAARRRNAMLTQARGAAATGDASAQQRLLKLDPEGAPVFIQAVAKMDDRQMAAAKGKIDQMGKMSATVLNADPKKQGMLYQQLVSMLPTEAQAKMPKQLNIPFLELSLSKALAMDQILENPKTIDKGDTGEVWKAGRMIDEFSTGKAEDRANRFATAAIKKRGSGSGSQDVKASDESLIYRQAVELLGGIVDKDGRIQVMNPEIRPKVQAIATRAANLFKSSGGSITRTQAVETAAKEIEEDEQPTYTEGQRAKDASGNVLIYSNGQWIPE